jgi:hypothetical protein
MNKALGKRLVAGVLYAADKKEADAPAETEQAADKLVKRLTTASYFGDEEEVVRVLR